MRIQLVKQLTEEAQKNPQHPEGKLLLGIMEKINKILAPGNPPLTQQAVDAYIEMISFYLSVYQGKSFYPSEEECAQIKRKLIEKFKVSSIKIKKWFYNMDEVWSKVRMIWAQLSPQQREKFRKDLTEKINAKLPSISSKQLASPQEILPDGKWVSNEETLEFSSDRLWVTDKAGGWKKYYYEIQGDKLILQKLGSLQRHIVPFKLTRNKLTLYFSCRVGEYVHRPEPKKRASKYRYKFSDGFWHLEMGKTTTEVFREAYSWSADWTDAW